MWVRYSRGTPRILSTLGHLLKAPLCVLRQDWEGVVGDPKAIRAAVLAREGAVLNLTADEKTLTSVEGALNSFLSALPTTGGQPQTWSATLEGLNEGLVVPTQVRQRRRCLCLRTEPAGYNAHGPPVKSGPHWCGAER